MMLDIDAAHSDMKASATVTRATTDVAPVPKNGSDSATMPLSRPQVPATSFLPHLFTEEVKQLF